MDWKRMRACVTGSVGQKMLRRNDHVVAENRIALNQIQERLRLSDEERRSLAENTAVIQTREHPLRAAALQ
jgi:hypothetical protein